MKIATTIGEMYRFVQNDPVKAIECYEGTGFRYLDYSFYNVLTSPNHPFMEDDWKKQIQSAKAAVQKLGMTFVQAHSPDYNPLQPEYDHPKGLTGVLRSIEACGMLGIRNLVLHAGAWHNYRYPNDKEAYFEANRPFFTAMIPYMETYGVDILIENSCENNMNGLYFPMTGADINDFISYLGHPQFAACWDTGHGHIQKCNIRDELVTLGNNLKALHIHDNDGERDQHLAPYTATFSMDDLMHAIIESGFTGYFTLEADSAVFTRPKIEHFDAPRLSPAPVAVKQAMLRYLYDVSKATLEAYGMFEE